MKRILVAALAMLVSGVALAQPVAPPGLSRQRNLSDLPSPSAARTNLGLGTMATQPASGVAVTGGAINGTPFGQTTPAPVAATTLSATGASTFGTPSLTPGLLNFGGTPTTTQGSIESSQMAFSYPNTLALSVRPRYNYDTVTVPSGTQLGIVESNWFAAEYTGSGTVNAEINTIHCYQQFDAGLSMTAVTECEEVSGENLSVGMNSHNSYTGLFSNGPSATITGTVGGLSLSYTNNNTTAGSWANYIGVICSGNNGAGANATNAACLQNFDANEMISSAGPARFGNIVNGSGSLNSTSVNTSHFNANQTWFNSSNVLNAFITGDGGLGVAFGSLGTFNATLVIGDEGGAATYGTHIGVQQTTAPAVANATLDATASDVTGTLTLTAANPVVTFHVAYHTVPHVVISSPSGTAFTYAVTGTGITFTGGASGNTVSYIVVQ